MDMMYWLKKLTNKAPFLKESIFSLLLSTLNHLPPQKDSPDTLLRSVFVFETLTDTILSGSICTTNVQILVTITSFICDSRILGHCITSHLQLLTKIYNHKFGHDPDHIKSLKTQLILSMMSTSLCYLLLTSSDFHDERTLIIGMLSKIVKVLDTSNPIMQCIFAIMVYPLMQSISEGVEYPKRRETLTILKQCTTVIVESRSRNEIEDSAKYNFDEVKNVPLKACLFKIILFLLDSNPSRPDSRRPNWSHRNNPKLSHLALPMSLSILAPKSVKRIRLLHLTYGTPIPVRTPLS
jgi:hypothetical protein